MINATVKIEKQKQGIYLISLNRPEKRNALNIDLMHNLCNAIEHAEKDEQARVIIIKGEGSVFCAGLDLEEANDESLIAKSSETLSTMFTKLYQSPLVTIAVVHGAALAGGAGLICACDFVIAAENTVFGFPETRRGLVAAQVMPLLFRKLQLKDIRELLLIGELIKAEKALKIGLINRQVPQEHIMGEAIKMADSVIKGAPSATSITKKLLDSLYPSCFAEDLKKALLCHQEIRHSSEAKEGITAFLEKRPPKWAN